MFDKVKLIVEMQRTLGKKEFKDIFKSASMEDGKIKVYAGFQLSGGKSMFLTYDVSVHQDGTWWVTKISGLLDTMPASWGANFQMKEKSIMLVKEYLDKCKGDSDGERGPGEKSG